jgi:hypothetical protein
MPGGKLGGEVVEYQPAIHFYLHDLAGAMEFPGKGAAGDRVAVKQAFVLRKVARVLRPTVAGKIGRSSAGKNARLQQLASDQVGWFWFAESHRHVKAVGHQITQRVADEQFNREQRMRR